MAEKVGFWWVMHSDELHALLVRAANGESPDELVMEAYLNSEHDYPEPDCSWPDCTLPASVDDRCIGHRR